MTSQSTPCPFTIRIATPADAPALVEIYRPYVERTAITFEYDVPSVADFAQRIARTLERHPYLVAEDADGNIVGYAYASDMKGRAAYDWTVELSVYLATNVRHQRLGTLFYQALTDLLLRQNVTTLYACITYSPREDALHDNSSLRFHEALGFKEVGLFHECGFKFGRWWDTKWMEKQVAPHKAVMPPFIPFGKLLADD